MWDLCIELLFTHPGQFWNVPITVQPYEYRGHIPTELDVHSLYSVCVLHPSDPSRDRKFVAEFSTQKWDFSTDTCFYSGNIQGGKLLEIKDDDFNDPVIEGDYEEYIVPGLFMNSFKYSQFSSFNLPWTCYRFIVTVIYFWLLCGFILKLNWSKWRPCCCTTSSWDCRTILSLCMEVVHSLNSYKSKPPTFKYLTAILASSNLVATGSTA